MASVILLLAAALLLAVPFLARRVHAELAPRVWARLTLSTTLGSVVLVEAAAIVCALPLLARAVGVPGPGHFFPGGSLAGWISLAVAVLLPARVLVVVLGVRRRRRLVRAEPWLGAHVAVDGIDVAVVSSDRPVAFAVPGRDPQILLSSAAMHALTDEELRLVLRHERAHIEHNHSRYLTWAEVLRPLGSRVPLLSDALDRLPVWLERWADDDSARTAEERQSVRRSLRHFVSTDLGPVATSMSPAETLLQRLDALEHAPAPSARPALLMIVGLTVLLLSIGIAPLALRLL